MEWANLVFTLIAGILGGSLGGAFINWILNMKAIKFNANYERKLNRYSHIIAMIEIYLHAEDVLDSIQMTMWDMKKFSIQENKSKAWKALLSNKRQLEFITGNANVVNVYDKFLKSPDEIHYEQVVQAMKKDLWGK